MILSDRDIKKKIDSKEILIKPAPNYTTQLSSCSLDLHLGSEFRVYEYSTIPYVDIREPVPPGLTRLVKIEKRKPFIIQPGELVLGMTTEWIEMPDDIAGRLEGRSSLARLGIIVHATASTIDPGWRGNIVLELSNIARLPVAIYPGMRICACTFETLSSPSEIPYYKRKDAKYAQQKGAVSSRIDKEL